MTSKGGETGSLSYDSLAEIDGASWSATSKNSFRIHCKYEIQTIALNAIHSSYI